MLDNSDAEINFEDDDGAVQQEWDLYGEEDDPESNQSNNQSNEDVEHLSQEDILMFLENESVIAAETASQEVRSHYTPHLNQCFDTDDAAFAFYNQYACICGFLAKKAGNYHAKSNGNTGVTRHTFRCNRYGKPVPEEVHEKRRQ
jgi:hypothetical protein